MQNNGKPNPNSPPKGRIGAYVSSWITALLPHPVWVTRRSHKNSEGNFMARLQESRVKKQETRNNRPGLKNKTRGLRKMGHNFENLEVYNRSQDLAKKVVSTFSELRPYRFSEQICASVVSVSSNIAEGSQRGTDKEFARFLEFSSGSAAELFTQLDIALDIYPDLNSQIKTFKEEAYSLLRMINGLRKRLKSNWRKLRANRKKVCFDYSLLHNQ